MRKVKVTNKPLRLEYGSTVRNLVGTHVKTHRPGTILTYRSSAPNGSVWFIDADGNPGRSMAGDVGRLIEGKRLKFIDQ